MQPITLVSVSSTQQDRRTCKTIVFSLRMAKRINVPLLGVTTCVT